MGVRRSGGGHSEFQKTGLFGGQVTSFPPFSGVVTPGLVDDQFTIPSSIYVGSVGDVRVVPWGTEGNDLTVGTLDYDNQSANFTVGLVVTGATSGATGLILADADAGATGTLTLQVLTGTFQNNDPLTDTSTGVADAVGALTATATMGLTTLFTAVPQGSVVPVACRAVISAGTTASALVRMYPRTEN